MLKILFKMLKRFWRRKKMTFPLHCLIVPARYQANAIVSNKPNAGAPVIFEDFPTHYNLLGHVEQLTQNGTITTDLP
jgi:predicted ATP-dependent protease